MGAKIELWDDGKTAAFDCPGCGMTHALNICEQVERPRWSFNGHEDAPTFTPSILARFHLWEPQVTPENLTEWKRAPWTQTKVEHVCHSFVTDGRIQFLGDCTHALANQTVDLKPYEV